MLRFVNITFDPQALESSRYAEWPPEPAIEDSYAVIQFRAAYRQPTPGSATPVSVETERIGAGVELH